MGGKLVEMVVAQQSIVVETIQELINTIQSIKKPRKRLVDIQDDSDIVGKEIGRL